MPFKFPHLITLLFLDILITYLLELEIIRAWNPLKKSHLRLSRIAMTTFTWDPWSGLISEHLDTSIIPLELIYFCETSKAATTTVIFRTATAGWSFSYSCLPTRETKSDRADTPHRLRNSFESDHASRMLFTTIISPVNVIRSLSFDVLRGILA